MRKHHRLAAGGVTPAPVWGPKDRRACTKRLTLPEWAVVLSAAAPADDRAPGPNAPRSTAAASRRSVPATPVRPRSPARSRPDRARTRRTAAVARDRRAGAGRRRQADRRTHAARRHRTGSAFPPRRRRACNARSRVGRTRRRGSAGTRERSLAAASSVTTRAVGVLDSLAAPGRQHGEVWRWPILEQAIDDRAVRQLPRRHYGLVGLDRRHELEALHGHGSTECAKLAPAPLTSFINSNQLPPDRSSSASQTFAAASAPPGSSPSATASA